MWHLAARQWLQPGSGLSCSSLQPRRRACRQELRMQGAGAWALQQARQVCLHRGAARLGIRRPPQRAPRWSRLSGRLS
jgi:hypothetical protein